VGERYPFHVPVNRVNPCVPDKQQLPGILVGGTCPGVRYSTTVVQAANAHANAPPSTLLTCERDTLRDYRETASLILRITY